MKIKWERNSRSKALADVGKIDHEDVIPRTTTDKFPAGAITVRMQGMREKIPNITLHIRGSSKMRSSWNNTYSYDAATTARVNMCYHNQTATSWDGIYSLSGDLDGDITFQDVHDAVTRVKEAMGI